ncbi:MAG: DEAD/DEAH box helicase family protein [Deltaproteobacteria bacterium]|nr:DEAD/DEAH box helicase family protein [Deltaproteobacteria bacterium]MBP6832215.1 DEAD/DEAH box helicase family protein [Deltaproteobacteria bacterium]
MSEFEVETPILNSPFDAPAEHWDIEHGRPAIRAQGRRPAVYYYRDPKAPAERYRDQEEGLAIELLLVNRIRRQLDVWRAADYDGVTRTTLELLRHWRREGRRQRLFFAQLEAAETVIFLVEAEARFRQGVEVPLDDPGEAKRAAGDKLLRRYACKMATGAGKTTVMAMLAAWSILNKLDSPDDARFSDAVLVVCPNVTIRQRLQELDPARMDASLYATRDLVPSALLPRLSSGRVVVTNWHVFEPRPLHVGDEAAKVVKAGVRRVSEERLTIGERKTTQGRGAKTITAREYEQQRAMGLLTVIEEKRDRDGELTSVRVESVRYEESDRAVLKRVLGVSLRHRKNVLVLNDEAHHAYRRRSAAPEAPEVDLDEEERDELEVEAREATVWVEGLDRLNRRNGVNFCVDLSATPYYLGSAGADAFRPYPWVVSDFGLTDAIESGLVKIPQLAARDTTGAQVPGYFNIWNWVIPQVTTSEKADKRKSPRPEAIVRYAHPPLAMVAGMWRETFVEWKRDAADPRSPVFIIVCKNIPLAKLLYEWIAEGSTVAGLPPFRVEELRNAPGALHTLRVDTKVVHETDTGETKDDELLWMRYTLDSVGRVAWPADASGDPVYPSGFQELAERLGRPLDPPGRGVRCIISVAMLTEGWDCSTVTHIAGLRPFASQLLCEQVVGRALRRRHYDLREDGRFGEELARVLGVPFQVVPYKQSPKGAALPVATRQHVRALSERRALEITFPRVQGYCQSVRNELTVNWSTVPVLEIDPEHIPSEVELRAAIPTRRALPSLFSPGHVDHATLDGYFDAARRQELVFDIAASLTSEFTQRHGLAPHIVFPQLVRITREYLNERVIVRRGAAMEHVLLGQYWQQVIEQLGLAIHSDIPNEAPIVPRLDPVRAEGSTCDVDFWTSKPVREVTKSHVNLVTADTDRWEQTAAYFIDTHPLVKAFVKNDGLGLTIPYQDGHTLHDYIPDFVVQLLGGTKLLIEVKGYDKKADIKAAAARLWVGAVTASGRFGRWEYRLVRRPTDVVTAIDDVEQMSF